MEQWNVEILGVKVEINHFNCKKLLQTHYFYPVKLFPISPGPLLHHFYPACLSSRSPLKCRDMAGRSYPDGYFFTCFDLEQKSIMETKAHSMPKHSHFLNKNHDFTAKARISTSNGRIRAKKSLFEIYCLGTQKTNM
jgi:hypothetical protein